MRITYKGDYALKAILDLALHYGQNLVTISELSERINAPAKFLEQILLLLKKGGFVESRRGKEGGYLLAKSPKEITLGEIVRYIDGPIEPVACIEKQYKGCDEVASCVLRQVWQQVNEAVEGIIDGITFEDLAKRKISQQPIYYI